MLGKKPSPESTPESRPLAIVVADDVEEIRQLVTHWLTSLGHTVLSAGNGRDLLKVVREQPVDLVITDIVMPDGDGHDAIATLTRLHPGLRIVAMSGGGSQMPSDAGLRLAKSLGADMLLSKPFTREQLVRAVEQVTRR